MVASPRWYIGTGSLLFLKNRCTFGLSRLSASQPGSRFASLPPCIRAASTTTSCTPPEVMSGSSSLPLCEGSHRSFHDAGDCFT